MCFRPTRLAIVLLWLVAALATVFLPSTVYRYYLAALVPASAFMVALWSLALDRDRDRASTPQDSQHAGECA